MKSPSILLKPALSELHLRGHISSAYIDDMYLQGQTYKECVHNVIDSVTRIDSLGLVAHPEKSVVNPSRQLEFSRVHTKLSLYDNSINSGESRRSENGLSRSACEPIL